MGARQKCVAFLDFPKENIQKLPCSNVSLFQNHRAAIGRPYGAVRLKQQFIV